MSILDEIKSTIGGAKVIYDWWGDGLRHVDQAKADHRSLACLRGNNGNPCPYNVAPNWWGTSKTVIASLIQFQMEIKDKLQLTTPFDEHLHMCKVCGCALPTKIWVPIEHVKKHTPEIQLKEFPSYCWQKKEMESHV